MDKQWYRINNKSQGRAEIMIFEQVGKDFWGDGVSAKEFVQELNKLNVSSIDLHINSPGGDVWEGNTIYNALKAHRAKVNVKIMGVAASIASVIAMAGDTVEMPENSLIMIHDPWTWQNGRAEDMRTAADMLDRVKIGLVSSYRNKTGLADKRITDMMAAETWFTAAEAIDLGFADTMTEAVIAQASFNGNFSHYRNAPECFKGACNNKINMRTTMDNLTEQISNVSPENQPIANRCQAEWNQNPGIRDEFQDDYESYLLYTIAEDKGKVRVRVGGM